MKVLIADFDLFQKMGGGQTFYRSLIKKNPQIDFYYIAKNEFLNTSRLDNSHKIPYQEVFNSEDFKNFFETTPPKWVQSAFVQASNIAASCTNMNFDVVDVPDYEQWGMFLRPALNYFHVNCGLIALSMHGIISKTLQLDWFEGKENIPLSLQEKMQYQTVDIRYGISKSYLDEWKKVDSLKTYYYNPLHFMDLPEVRLDSTSKSLPSLNFIGRTEKRKGPDIFVDLIWWIPRDKYSNASIIGPHSYNYNGTQSSEDYLEKMIKNRGKDLKICSPMSHLDLVKLFNSKSITFVPSRYDTLNLVALESLFSGCPTIIGNGAGVCRFLEDNFPKIPFIKIDINNIYDSLPEIINLLNNYDDYRNKLIAGIRDSNFTSSDPLLKEIYSSSPTSNSEICEDLNRWYSQLISYWESGQLSSLDKIPGLRLLKSKIRSNVKPIYQQIKNEVRRNKELIKVPLSKAHNAQVLKAPKLVRRYKHIFNTLELTQKDLDKKIQECWKLGSNVDYESEGIRSRLGNGYRIDRARLWKGIARIEDLRGNELVAVTYKLRSIRLLNKDLFDDLPSIVRVLKNKGFTKESDVIEAMYSTSEDKEDKCYQLLEQNRLSNSLNNKWNYEFLDDRRHKSTYRVSIIVSLYNASSKLVFFLKTLKHQTLIQKKEAEIILIDSGSPGDEYTVFKQIVDDLDIPVVYARSKERETIQMAWNRGIDLSKADFLSFLGVDETILPNCLEILAHELDKAPDLDWVTGHSLVTEVDSNGGWVSDIMPYYRKEYRQDLVYLETCYLSWVGALYRRSIHKRFGYYDSSFRGAGDTEFKSRILPFIKSKIVDCTLGVFWNYPDERTTQSPAIEIEDMRAWYIHRTLGGIRYAFANRSMEEVENLIYLCLCYRKSYCTHTSTDLEYAYNLCLYLKEIYPQSKVLKYFNGIETLIRSYRSLDCISKLSQWSPLKKILEIRKVASQIQKEHRASWNKDLSLGLEPTYTIFNDNRHEQHSSLWFTQINK
ncbi:MAG: glycosyltransferase [Candidatus Atelocyanobacterium thalassa isolate SIO64986]|uniref:Glycosyltransferase n=1 Tax=Candidatus Atelocyanobacterium thalassa isolate SIO64986 TaxID=1527444 RepID=A0A086CH25_9CHRO|nr:MAG: glycosyltransferase [Candidatus Atelocyanobacterium thalassa isolate SIO64986]